MFNINKVQFHMSDILQYKFTVYSQPFPYNVEYSEFLPENIEKVVDYQPGDIFIIDENVYKLYKFQLSTIPLLICAKEEHKSIETVLNIVEQLSCLHKKNKIICIGGGITQDICATFCKLYKRGIDWIFIPTTLLAMADSCIGAKSCLNYKGMKNQLGLFSAPTKILINPKFLTTLSSKDIESGYGEIIKLHIIGNMVKNYQSSIEYQILNSLHIKKMVIEVDEFEIKGLRMALNYGHTIGHALESLFNYLIPHGEAVLNGIYLVNKLFNIPNLDIVKPTIPNLLNTEISQLVSLMKKDKKATDKDIHFVLSVDGNTFYDKMNYKDIERKLCEII